MVKNNFSDSLKPLKREPISVTILNMITDNIISGTLKPGDKLPTEIELAESLGVGRNSVREAIKMVSSFGAIEVKMGSGTFIANSMPGFYF
jgi:GntR family transcriptional repressor for pyruvate dehydrogenase complex